MTIPLFVLIVYVFLWAAFVVSLTVDEGQAGFAISIAALVTVALNHWALSYLTTAFGGAA